MKNWYYSVIVGVVYLLCFHAFMHCKTHQQVIIVGIVGAAFLGILMALNFSYFVNGMDVFVHLSIILDIAIEAIFIYPHDHFGFYGCAIAFAIVLVAFRRYSRNKNLPETLPTAISS